VCDKVCLSVGVSICACVCVCVCACACVCMCMRAWWGMRVCVFMCLREAGRARQLNSAGLVLSPQAPSTVMGVTDYFDTRCGTVVFAVAVTVVCACMILAVVCPTAATRSLYTRTRAGGILMVLT